jgi:hypothetical protein
MGTGPDGSRPARPPVENGHELEPWCQSSSRWRHVRVWDQIDGRLVRTMNQLSGRRRASPCNDSTQSPCNEVGEEEERSMTIDSLSAAAATRVRYLISVPSAENFRI